MRTRFSYEKQLLYIWSLSTFVWTAAAVTYPFRAPHSTIVISAMLVMATISVCCACYARRQTGLRQPTSVEYPTSKR